MKGNVKKVGQKLRWDRLIDDVMPIVKEAVEAYGDEHELVDAAR